MATEVRSSRWRNLSVVPDSGSLVYWISKIKVPLSHHKGSGGQVEALCPEPSRTSPSCGEPCGNKQLAILSAATSFAN